MLQRVIQFLSEKGVMETFGEWLRGERTARRLSREEFANRVGCSVALLRKIEDGERRPSAQIAELIANCLDIPLEERSTFVRVAREELRVDRLLPEWKPGITLNITAPKTNLPVFPTPFIGRERELEHLSRFLCDPQCRLLTLVGPGGIGKTRLAIETASNMQDLFVNGVYFVSLAPVNATSFIVPLIADALGFTFQSAGRNDPKTQLFSYLKEKQVLLLADNLEHLLNGPGIEVLSELLANAPQVKLLTTSRESLGLQGEWIFEVHGLPVPENPQTEGFAQDTSAELFLQRARRAYVEFSATSDDFPAILRICHLVDGMPLALELAAAWVRTLTCAEIAKEIERSLDFLSISARDVPARHRSMRAVFDHSWKLLAEEEKQVLARLSVFRGGFGREAAEQVAEATLAVLSTLVTKSLIRRSSMGRYDLHDVIRHFAAEHFSERLQDQAATRARHSSYYLTHFGQADGRLRSSAQRETLAELTTEMDNFRSAWDWAVTHGEFALIEQAMRTFWILYDTRGWLQEGLDLLGRALNALQTAHGDSGADRINQVALGHILTCRAVLATRLGSLRLPANKPRDSYERLQSVVMEWRTIGDPRLTAVALQNLSWMAVRLGLHDEARDALEESVWLNTSIGDRWNLGFAYRGLGLIAQAQGEHLQAVDMFRKSLDTLTEVGARQDEARVLVQMSHSIFALGNDAEAERGWREALRVTVETQGTFVALEALVGIAMLKAKQGNIEQAVELLLIVSHHSASLQETKDGADHLRAQLEAQLTRTQIERIQVHAGKKTFGAVVEDLLSPRHRSKKKRL